MSGVTSKPVCHLCGSDRSELHDDRVSQAPGSRIYKCSACELVYLFPIMTPEEESAFYRSEWDKYMLGRSGPNWKSPAQHFRSYQAEGERRLGLIRDRLKAEDSVLEVGSSTGYFLDDLRGYVKRVKGVEPNRLQREHANGIGIETVRDISDTGAEKFDAIFLYYVVEHFRDPVGSLRDLKGRLNPGGRVIIEVPNVDDVLLAPYRIPQFAPFYWQKAHYFNFSHKTMKAVLDRAGYASEVFPVQRYDLSNHMVWMMEGKPGGAGRFKTLFTPALEAAYADALKASWRCDTVMAVSVPA